MTPKIKRSTIQAAPVCEPKNRERRFSRFGDCMIRMLTKTSSDDDHRAGEEVLDEPDERGVPDERDVEVALEETAVGLDDGEQQDGEAPEGEEVGQAGHGPLEQLASARRPRPARPRSASARPCTGSARPARPAEMSRKSQ